MIFPEYQCDIQQWKVLWGQKRPQILNVRVDRHYALGIDSGSPVYKKDEMIVTVFFEPDALGGANPRFLHAGVPFWDLTPHPLIRRFSAENLTLL